MPGIEFVLSLVTSQPHFPSIDDNDVISGVHVRGIDWLVFATQNGGNLTRHAPKDFSLGVDEIPATLNIFLLRAEGFHIIAGSFGLISRLPSIPVRLPR